MRLFFSDLAKLRRRLATWLTLGLLAGLLSLVFIAVGGTANRAATQPGARAALAIVSAQTDIDFVVWYRVGAAYERLQAPADARDHPHYDFIHAEWARKWPSEDLWRARKRA